MPENYQELSAEDKLDILWKDNIIPNDYKEDAPAVESMRLFEMLKLLSKAFLAKTFDHTSDEMPEGRVKLIHPYGSVVQVEYVPAQNNKMSGILNTGAFGLARLSLAGNPGLLGYTPGMGLKFLIDGKPSVNLHVMNSLSGQSDNQNFFALEFSNIIPKPPLTLILLAKAFSRVKDPPTELNVNGLTEVEADGNVVSLETRAPVYQLVFSPNPKLSIDPDTKNDFRYELSKIREDSVLYAVYAKETKKSQFKKIGVLVTRSRFVASTYGDENLFFQHQR